MKTSRRTLLATGLTGGLALTAGCLDFVRGEGPLEFEADRVAPAQSALDDTGYREERIEQERIEETIDVGVEREVGASVWISTYTKEIEYDGELREASAFAAISMPALEVAGRSVNPVDEMTTEELLEEFLEEVGDGGEIENVEHRESFALEILDETRDVDVFRGETDLADDRVDVELTTTVFDHESDLVVLLGTHPAVLAEESATIEELMESVEHPA